MPTSKIKKDAREGKGSKKTLEKKWDESKEAAKGKHGKNNWPLTMYIYKKKTHQAALGASLIRLATTDENGDIDVSKLELGVEED